MKLGSAISLVLLIVAHIVNGARGHFAKNCDLFFLTWDTVIWQGLTSTTLKLWYRMKIELTTNFIFQYYFPFRGKGESLKFVNKNFIFYFPSTPII